LVRPGVLMEGGSIELFAGCGLAIPRAEGCSELLESGRPGMGDLGTASSFFTTSAAAGVGDAAALETLRDLSTMFGFRTGISELFAEPRTFRRDPVSRGVSAATLVPFAELACGAGDSAGLALAPSLRVIFGSCVWVLNLSLGWGGSGTAFLAASKRS
jgi:hypothetical protein